MERRRQLLDEAISIARKELDLLVAEDVFEAEKLAYSRMRILDEAVEGLSREDMVQLGGRLEALKSLHDEVTEAARRLRQSLKQDLSDMKKQTRRLSGYSLGAGNAPRLAKERFLSKKG